jgi:chorismate dehydratase
MTIRVAHLPYVSSEPFYFDMERRGFKLLPMTPSAISSAAGAGEIDAGPFPLADCRRLSDGFRPLSGFCIATISRAGSVFLHSARPISDLDGSRIGVTGEASTALTLLQVLLSLKYQVKPEAYVSLEEPSDALLHIGNLGLRNRRGVRGFPHNYDLGEEWFQWTGLPLVLARWMVRKDLDSSNAAMLEDAIYTSLQDWSDGLFHLSDPRNSVRMHPQDILLYSQGFRYFIGVTEQKSIDLFQEYLLRIAP